MRKTKNEKEAWKYFNPTERERKERMYTKRNHCKPVGSNKIFKLSICLKKSYIHKWTIIKFLSILR